MENANPIPEELVAAYLDGTATLQDIQTLLREMQTNPELCDVMQVLTENQDMENSDFYPMMRMAAENQKNLCAFYSELYVLKKRNIPVDEYNLLQLAKENYWVTEHGTPLHAIGQLLASQGLMVTHRYEASLQDIKSALSFDNDVIAVVDNDKLYPGRSDAEDAPNHAVVVVALDESADSITLFEPEAYTTLDFALSDFVLAWHESRNYMVRILRSEDDYEPHPLNLDDITLTDDLLELQEAIAENAHEVWAAARKAEGWTYGPVRNDALKQHPDLIPYSALPDSEKEYDRLMAFNTIKLVKKLGWKLVK